MWHIPCLPQLGDQCLGEQSQSLRTVIGLCLDLEKKVSIYSVLFLVYSLLLLLYTLTSSLPTKVGVKYLLPWYCWIPLKSHDTSALTDLQTSGFGWCECPRRLQVADGTPLTRKVKVKTEVLNCSQLTNHKHFKHMWNKEEGGGDTIVKFSL